MAEGGPSSSDNDGFLKHDPKECLKLKPKKSILKSQSSFDEIAAQLRRPSQSGAHFDEMNIVATHHPDDKDYGHMKIEEPKTPYHYYSDSDEDAVNERTRGVRRVSISNHDRPINPSELTEKMESDSSLPKVLQTGVDDDYDSDEETQEQKQHRSEFERKRREHYNEGEALKRAKQLLAEEMAELERLEEDGK